MAEGARDFSGFTAAVHCPIRAPRLFRNPQLDSWCHCLFSWKGAARAAYLIVLLEMTGFLTRLVSSSWFFTSSLEAKSEGGFLQPPLWSWVPPLQGKAVPGKGGQPSGRVLRAQPSGICRGACVPRCTQSSLSVLSWFPFPLVNG